MSSCCENNHSHGEEELSKQDVFFTILGVIAFVFAIILNNKNSLFSTLLYGLSYILIGYKIVFHGISHMFKKDMFDENFLMVVATLGAFAIQEYNEAIAVILLYKIGEFLQDKAVENSRKKITEAIDIREKSANLKVGDKIKKVDSKDLKVGEYIIVKNGEKVPVDGILRSSLASLDMSSLTGESKAVSLEKNVDILSGSINIGKVIEIEVTKTYENSTVYKIFEMIEKTSEKKSTTEKFITKFSKVYTPIVTLIALVIALMPLVTNYTFNETLHKAFTFLVISCPCALVISVPLSFFVGIGSCSKKGILVKGSNFLDSITDVFKIAFDKTGTITKGHFSVTRVENVGNLTKEEVLETVAKAEYYSNHYIAKSILNYCALKGKKIEKSDILNHEEIAGKGIIGTLNEKEILVGNLKLMQEKKVEKISLYENNGKEIDENATIVYLSIDKKCEGYVVLEDKIKEDALDLVNNLNKVGVKEVALLTGDEEKVAKKIATKLGIKEVYSKLLPNEKADILEKMQKENNCKKIAFVGDGINDAPVLALADVGISMGKGSDLALETSDIAIMSDEPSKIVDLFKISKKTKKIVKENIVFAISIKVIFLVCSFFFTLPMWCAIFADVGVALLTILNALRIFNVKR